MKKKLLRNLILLLLFGLQTGFAQQKTVKGTITDESGLPLPGVNVLVKGTIKGTQTDFDGNFTINANEGQVLVFSFLGFKTFERRLSTDLSELALY